MELVLGLAALATAVSGMAGAGHYDDAPEITEAEPTTVQTVNETTRLHELPEGLDLPKPHIGDSDLTLVGSNPLVGWEDTSDEKEVYNDDFEHAQEVGNYNYGFYGYRSGNKPLSYEKTITGYINQQEDVDYYKFTTYGKANVTIELRDIPWQNDYDIELYAHSNMISGTPNADELVGGSYHFDNDDEHFEKLIYANTYYIKVYSDHGWGSPKYTISLKVEYQCNDLTISDLKANNARGALWYSDYDPYGIKPSLSNSRMTYQSLSNGPFTHRKNVSYKHAELYIFDNALKEEILSVLNTVVTSVQDKIREDEEGSLMLDRINMGADIFYTVLSFAGPVGAAISLARWLNTVASTLLYDILDFLFPNNPYTFTISRNDYIAYLNGLIGLLTGYDADSNNGKVLAIPMNYRFVTVYERFLNPATGMLMRLQKNVFTYEPEDISPAKCLREIDSIPAQDPSNPVTGTIYPIILDGDLDRALNERKARAFVDPTLILDQTKTIDGLYKGKCQWLSFTAPHDGDFRISSSGDSFACVDVFNEKPVDPMDPNYIARAWRTPGCYCGFSYDFALNRGETLWFRLYGINSNNNEHYCKLSQTNIVVNELELESLLSFGPSDLGLGYTWSNSWRYSNITNPGNIYVESRGTFIDEETGFIKMKCDSNDICSAAWLTLRFDRPIKSFTFSGSIANCYSYACLGLYAYGLNSDDDLAVTDIIDPNGGDCAVYGDYFLHRTVLNYKNDERTVGHDIYGVCFRLDPATDQSPYHVSYQEQWLTDFTVEFAD